MHRMAYARRPDAYRCVLRHSNHIRKCTYRHAHFLPLSGIILRRHDASTTAKTYPSIIRGSRRAYVCSPSAPLHFINTFTEHDATSSSHSFNRHFSTINNQQRDSSTSVLNDNEASIERRLPAGIIRQSDVFGETITFAKDFDNNSLSCVNHSESQNQSNQNSGSNNSQLISNGSIGDEISSFDNMSLCIISRGSANVHNGNDGDGSDARAFHSSSLAWSELLQYAWGWNCNNLNGESVTSAPMLAVAASAPVLAQGGSHYLRRIDRLLGTTRDSASTPPSLWTMAHNAASFRDSVLSTTPRNSSSSRDDDMDPIHLFTPRERWHLHALHQLLQNNHRDAIGAYLRLLELFPGDLLGLSLALDVAYTLGDANAALQAATSVSSYWTERGGGALEPRTFSSSLAMSLIAAGLSPSRASTAERLAETAIARDADGAGGISVWALSHSLASEGRPSEMVSKLAGFDGTQFYEACGYLHFHTRIKGYGGIALLDRRGAGADRSALRLYDGGFGNVLEYSGNNVEGIERGGEEVCLREMRVPRSIKKEIVDSMFTGWFGGGINSSTGDGAGQKGQVEGANAGLTEQRSPRLQRRTIEDVLCWLPPSPLLLAHATALLFRLTLCDGIPESDDRWADLAAAWKLALRYESDNVNVGGKKTPIEYMPLAMLASSLLIEPSEVHLNEVSQPLPCAMQGLNKMGKLMKLGQPKTEAIASVAAQQSDTSLVEEWREVLQLLASARDPCQRWEMPLGMSSSTYILLSDESGDTSTTPHHPIAWDFDLRQLLEHALCFAAMEVGDYESLCLARAICSEGTTLRSNCPEVWWRYGGVLDMLGDDVAAENARATSVSLGSGEGG